MCYNWYLYQFSIQAVPNTDILKNCISVAIIIDDMIINTYHGCLAKFDLARHMLNLAGKCLVTGHYHKPCCVAQNFENFAVHKQSG